VPRDGPRRVAHPDYTVELSDEHHAVITGLACWMNHHGVHCSRWLMDRESPGWPTAVRDGTFTPRELAQFHQLATRPQVMDEHYVPLVRTP
jgi:hypothetical protein